MPRWKTWHFYIPFTLFCDEYFCDYKRRESFCGRRPLTSFNLQFRDSNSTAEQYCSAVVTDTHLDGTFI